MPRWCRRCAPFAPPKPGISRNVCVFETAALFLRLGALARWLQALEAMPVMKVTCPESGHLETIELERRGRSLVVLACSAFGEDCPLGCEQTCAARLTMRYRERQELGPGSVILARSCLAR